MNYGWVVASMHRLLSRAFGGGLVPAFQQRRQAKGGPVGQPGGDGWGGGGAAYVQQGDCLGAPCCAAVPCPQRLSAVAGEVGPSAVLPV